MAESYPRRNELQLPGTAGFAPFGTESAELPAAAAPAGHIRAPGCRKWESESSTLTMQRQQSNAEYAPHWFAVFTSSRHEKRVAQHFADRRVEFFLPLYHPIRRWKNRCTMQLDLPLFPGYIFARIDRRERMRVLLVPGVLSIVGIQQEPSPIPDAYIDALREGLCLCKAEPHPTLTAGERVRVTRGAMTGMEGILLRRSDNFRVVITLGIIQQSVAVEVDAADLELVANGELADSHWEGLEKHEQEMVGVL